MYCWTLNFELFFVFSLVVSLKQFCLSMMSKGTPGLRPLLVSTVTTWTWSERLCLKFYGDYRTGVSRDVSLRPSARCVPLSLLAGAVLALGCAVPWVASAECVGDNCAASLEATQGCCHCVDEPCATGVLMSAFCGAPDGVRCASGGCDGCVISKPIPFRCDDLCSRLSVIAMQLCDQGVLGGCPPAKKRVCRPAVGEVGCSSRRAFVQGCPVAVECRCPRVTVTCE
jgi:hypothetical protein